MAKMKEYIDNIKACSMCWGQGFLYYGNEEMYDIDTCICNPQGLDIN